MYKVRHFFPFVSCSLLVSGWLFGVNTVIPLILPIAPEYAMRIQLHKCDLEHFLHTIGHLLEYDLQYWKQETSQMGRTEWEV